ncbi:MAG TPA: S-methyl-5'-thioadenosine phosphorylase [Alphaproteobacteria bacterium]|nr:MAG: S-methyl-5'-thioadenosine phosphorylase [Alphaproteobacteria bacterium MarineAlpha9_Bin6]PPR40162.1 MAG: S-methyl-5'-thioadenosine phosphorylase [Alphaproteobacteria bacterium MarineAlpha9_Bin5]HHZ67804.1 S-methyl-5'-thioadenosine phosphorylase [Alphaproteobacteria bacterium]HIB17724.1 S-methyl-5'-thioadenosine phosphorylase [Alphaproteobacteria bacterium]HIB56216.1 S-methyl-5'-thioadenosine phosphorylase [Alphaproteobacteria bacterium]
MAEDSALDTPEVIGVMGGTGVDQLDGLTNVRRQAVDTPFGAPSAHLMIGTLGRQRILFLPRHGEGHRIPPSEINFRANMYALKAMGCTQLISISAVGSLREHLAPGRFVLVDQFIDRTYARAKSFFGTGLVAHVSLGDPVCHRLGSRIMTAAQAAEIEMEKGGTYLVMEGPQFSTRAESELYRSWGCDVIGMTNMPEAKLAREAEICYASVAMVTDYDCWHPHHDDVTVEAIVKVLIENADKARAVVSEVVPGLSADCFPCPHGCRTALDSALVTASDARDADSMSRLDAILARNANV